MGMIMRGFHGVVVCSIAVLTVCLTVCNLLPDGSYVQSGLHCPMLPLHTYSLLILLHILFHASSYVFFSFSFFSSMKSLLRTSLPFHLAAPLPLPGSQCVA